MSSSSGQGVREWRFYVSDMIEFTGKIISFTEGMDQDRFVSDPRTYDATLRNLEMIGEAATHIPLDVREAHPEIHWRSIIGTRNRVAHAYLGIDDDVIWNIVQEDIPELLPLLRDLLYVTRKDSP